MLHATTIHSGYWPHILSLWACVRSGSWFPRESRKYKIEDMCTCRLVICFLTLFSSQHIFSEPVEMMNRYCNEIRDLFSRAEIINIELTQGQAPPSASVTKTWRRNFTDASSEQNLLPRNIIKASPLPPKPPTVAPSELDKHWTNNN